MSLVKHNPVSSIQGRARSFNRKQCYSTRKQWQNLGRITSVLRRLNGSTISLTDIALTSPAKREKERKREREREREREAIINDCCVSVCVCVL